MLRNFDAVLLQLDGQEFVPPMTLGKAVHQATANAMQADQNLDLNAKMNLYRLAKLGFEGGVQDITAEDISVIKERASKMFTNYVFVGRVIEALESDYVKPE
jgi:hypothetical protein